MLYSSIFLGFAIVQFLHILAQRCNGEPRCEVSNAQPTCSALPRFVKEIPDLCKGQNVQNAWPQNASRSVLDLHGFTTDISISLFPFCFFLVNLDQRAQVWTGNLQHEFSLFSQCLRSAAVVAIDTEFPGVIQENAWKESEETHYRAMKDWTSCFFFVLDNHWQFQWVPGSLFF